jgi:transposase-like protein
MTSQCRSRRRERRISKRLDAETVERLVAEHLGGTIAAEIGRRYGVANSSVHQLVRQAGQQVRQPPAQHQFRRLN